MDDFERVCAAVALLLQTARAPVLLAIDGRCASGKTTLAARLGRHFNAPVFHTDDFYLPFSARTPQRLAQAGGHVDAERLAQEVLWPARAGQAFVCRPYNAHTDTWGPAQRVLPQKLYITEGAYCLLPALEKFYDYKMFLTAQENVRRARLLAREGEQKLQAFLTRWIPAEEKYFAACGVPARADAVFDTSDWW